MHKHRTPTELAVGVIKQYLSMPKQVKNNLTASEPAFQLVPYAGPTGVLAEFRFDPRNDAVWGTQQQIADAFGVAASTIRGHLANIFKEGELDDSVCRKYRSTAPDGKSYQTKLYSLDAILAVGYRVSGKRATAFRQFATKTLKDYVTRGFALNTAQLEANPAALQSLSDQVRALRTSEKSLYSRIKDGYMLLVSDFDANSADARRFFARLQDRFTYAATHRASAQILLERADHAAHCMGLRSMQGEQPTKADAVVAKNYLDDAELKRLQATGDVFLIWLEDRAAAGAKLTMAEMSKRLDDVMRVLDRPIFPGYQGFIGGRAKQHAEREYGLYAQALAAPKRKAVHAGA